MPHEITKSDVLILNSGQPAWHGLGTVVNRALSPREAVREVLPWEPEARFVYFYNPVSCEYEIVKNYKVNVRDDNQEPLGIVSDFYQIVPNKSLGDFAEAIAGADAAFQVETCGSLLGGRRVFMLVKVPQSIRVGNNGDDETHSYLAIANSHDGTSSLFAMWTSVRIVCANTLSMALGANFKDAIAAADKGRAFRFRHSGDIHEKVEEARRMLALATTDTERFQVIADQMARKNLSVADIDTYFTACYISIYGPRPNPAPDNGDKVQTWEDRLKVRLSEWHTLLEDPNNKIAGISGTLWAALNSVTQWHDHSRSKTRVTQDRRVHSNLFGESARDKRGAFTAAVALLT